MKFFLLSIFTALLYTVSLAQNVQIGFPADGTTIAAGSNFTVQIIKEITASSSQEVAVVLGLQACTTGQCLPVDEALQRILYDGPFNPQTPPPESLMFPFQNFTVNVPDFFPKGLARLGVAHYVLVGANLFPFLQTLSVDLTIV